MEPVTETREERLLTQFGPAPEDDTINPCRHKDRFTWEVLCKTCDEARIAQMCKAMRAFGKEAALKQREAEVKLFTDCNSSIQESRHMEPPDTLDSYLNDEVTYWTKRNENRYHRRKKAEKVLFVVVTILGVSLAVLGITSLTMSLVR